MPTTPEVLRDARTLIDTPEKWHNEGGFFGPGGTCTNCAGGAIGVATDGHCSAKNTDAYRALAQAIRPRKRPRTDAQAEDVVWTWNDAKRRTHPEVLAAFDRAIALAEAS